MQITAAEILLKGLCQAPRGQVTAVVTDSRKIQPGCVFVCFEGARVDGHSFAAAAAEQGAAYIVGTRPVEGVPPEKMIVVKDPALAMVEMAANYRPLFSPAMVGVTGSVGKTTTKEFCAAVLEAFGPTVKTEGNQNNEIGMPNTLFKLEDATRYAVVEMGMSHLGEISRLSRAARPCAGIITCIGVSHLENLGSRENILKAKLEICEGLPDGAPLVLNRDDDLLRQAEIPPRLNPVWVSLEEEGADVWAQEITADGDGETFVLKDRLHGSFTVRIPALGRHTVRDALQAYAAATRLGLDPARAAAALQNYRTTGMRQHVVHHGGVTVVEDCYNASPDSMKAAFETFGQIPGRRHIALLGDMLELGEYSEQAHRELGRLAAGTAPALLVALGSAGRYTCREAAELGVNTLHAATREEAAAALAEFLQPGDALLAKGSRGMQLEKVLDLVWPERTEETK